MKLAIMQPYFFPYVGYWQLIHAVDRFVIYDDVNYIRGGWVNRNRILINGKPTYITVPLHQASQNKRICDITLQSSPGWRDKLVKSVENTYRKAPFFTEVFPVVEQLIRHETDSLSDYLANQLQPLSAFMGIITELVMTSRRYENDGRGLGDVHKIINFQLGNSSPPHRRLGGRYRVRLCVLVVAWEEGTGGRPEGTGGRP